MVSPSTSAPNKNKQPRNCNHGFTIIEIIIAISILIILFSLGLFITMDFYKSYSFRQERDTIASILQKARSQSLNNIDEKQHGVHFFLDTNNGNILTYLLFECQNPCSAYPGTTTTDILIPASYHSTIIAPVLPFDVIFKQLSGDCVVSTSSNVFHCDTSEPIIVRDGTKSQNITVNSEGRIDW